MMDNLFYYNQSREVPDTAKKPILGGRLSGKTEINPMWRIKKLTEMFGPCGIGWYYKSVREWLETYETAVAAFVKIELYIKVNDQWSMPIYGIGGSMFVEMQKGSPYVSDECYKMATTDAVSVACKQLGIGADVYLEKDRTKYNPPAGQQDTGRGRGQDNERKALMGDLSGELTRTGYSWNAVSKTYKVDNINNMTNLQIKDCISRMKKLPDKEESA